MIKYIKKIVAVICIMSLLSVSVSAAEIGSDTRQVPRPQAGGDTETDLTEMTDDLFESFLSEVEAIGEKQEGESEESAETESEITESDEIDESEEASENDEDIVLDKGLSGVEIESYEAITWPLKTGTHETYMKGDEKGYFNPENPITRAEFATVIYALLKNKPASTAGKFTDVPSSQWYTSAVNAVGNAGIMVGDNGKFRPNGKLTRAEAVVVFAKFFNTVYGTMPYTDVSTAHWAYSSIVTAQNKKWISGVGSNLFNPDGNITRASVTTLANRVLERTGTAGYAANINDTTKYFKDVPKTYWAFKDIIEAAEPVVKADPEPDPTPTPSDSKYYKVTAIDGLNMRSGPGTNYEIVYTLTVNSVVTAIDTTSNAGWFKVAYGSYTGYVSSDYLAATTDAEPSIGGGDGTISASSATIPLYKTLYLTGSGGKTWESDNTNIITIAKTKIVDSSKTFVYAKAKGTANVILRNSAGAQIAKCQITVTSPEAVRFTATVPNTPSTGSDFKLIAVTDTAKTAVKFVLSGPASGTYETTTYSTETQAAVNSASSLPNNVARIFTKTIKLTTAGTYTLKAYSKDSSGSWSTAYTQDEILVTSTGSATATSADKRATSDEMMKIIANFEGKYPEVYLDDLASNIPTVGCGYVVAKNTTFYNNLTETEMMAMLSDTINNDGYEAAVERFRSNNNLRMSQCQFDALVSFAYNLGGGSINSSYGTFKVMLNATAPVTGAATVSTGSPKLYSEASSSSKQLAILASNTNVTVSEVKRIDGNVDNLWYKVSTSVGTGWVRGGYIKMNNAGTKDLAYVDEQAFGSNLLLWHNAGGKAVAGLLTRRLAEAKIFAYGAYDKAYHSSSEYTKNEGFDVPSNFNYSESNGRGSWTVK